MPKPLHLLQMEYVESVLDAAIAQLPGYVNEELHAAGFNREIVSMVKDGETRIGICQLDKKTLLFHGPLVMATPIGRLPAQVALLVAKAFLWVKRDDWYHDERRVKRWAREWGFQVEQETA